MDTGEATLGATPRPSATGSAAGTDCPAETGGVLSGRGTDAIVGAPCDWLSTTGTGETWAPACAPPSGSPDRREPIDAAPDIIGDG